MKNEIKIKLSTPEDISSFMETVMAFHDDVDLIAVSSIDKVLLFNTSMINSKTSKNTIGVQIQKQKNDSATVEYVLASSFETDDLEYYRVKSAGIGKYRK